MAPKTVGGDAVIWAEDFSVNLAPTPFEVIYVDGTGDYAGCKVPKEVKRRPIPSFGVPKGGGLLGADGESESAVPTLGEDEFEPVDTTTAHKEPWDDFKRKYSDTYNGWIIETKRKRFRPRTCIRPDHCSRKNSSYCRQKVCRWTSKSDERPSYS